MSNGKRIVRLFGPPGTGKTTTLSARVKAYVDARGPDSILVTSFSTTAANEIRGRGLALPDRAVGTLHSHALHTIGSPHIALDPAVLADWNKTAPSGWRITPNGRNTSPDAAQAAPVAMDNTDADEANVGGGTRMAGDLRTGDALLSEVDRLRAAGGVNPMADATPQVRAFHEAWDRWKHDAEAVDFADMIELATLHALSGTTAPGNPEVIVVDEAQDMTPAEVELTMAWAQHASQVIYALDDDQAIMEWRGGDPTRLLDDAAILTELGDGATVDEELLDQSWRVPSSVHACAQRLIHKVVNRREKIYHPRTERGACYVAPHRMGDRGMLDEIEQIISTGESVMVLATCQYMLEPLLQDARRRGLPFGNAYRPAERRWNPLAPSDRGMSTAERIGRYLASSEDLGDAARLWTGDDIRAWITLVDSKTAHLRRGAKTDAAKLPRGEVPWELVADLWANTPEGEASREHAVLPDPGWLDRVLMPSRADVAHFPLRVAATRGAPALIQQPLLTVGTIHSVKGGASDHVYLDPSLSAAAAAQNDNARHRESMQRLFYVGLTRARVSLRVLQPPENGRRAFVPPRALVPADLEVLP